MLVVEVDRVREAEALHGDHPPQRFYCAEAETAIRKAWTLESAQTIANSAITCMTFLERKASGMIRDSRCTEDG
jgi:hypothetical protein